jgi:hypothetical protein
MVSQGPIKKHLDLRGSLERGGNDARRHRTRRRSERNTLLRVSPNAVAVSRTIDIWPRHAIALVLNARVQRGRAPLGAVAGADRAVRGLGRCSLENNVVMLKINVVHRRMLTAGTQCGGGLTRSFTGEYGCGVASDGGSGVPPRNAPSVSQRV